MLSFDFKEVLAHAVLSIERHGFINKDMALVNGTLPTSELVLNNVIDSDIDATSDARVMDLTDDIIDWLSDVELTGSNEFMDKCRALATDGIKSIGEIGMTGYMVQEYQTFLRNRPMIECISEREFSHVPLGDIKSIVKDLHLGYLGTVYLQGGALRELLFVTGDNQLVALYKRQALASKKESEQYIYKGSIKNTLFKYNSFMTILRNHRYDIRVE